ncbi:hypothetical protein GCM10007877_03970 [Marinibactrum halimedae]|uniref:Uncharacterized protein n=2 Tax=Marinibactrum halimedae TaxID=1444977 RepID=A0AA37T1S9_9GAMM|nr:hypothetical protein GCM10007877_03970 [Marinibactrum halimedae]
MSGIRNAFQNARNGLLNRFPSIFNRTSNQPSEPPTAWELSSVLSGPLAITGLETSVSTDQSTVIGVEAEENPSLLELEREIDGVINRKVKVDADVSFDSNSLLSGEELELLGEEFNLPMAEVVRRNDIDSDTVHSDTVHSDTVHSDTVHSDTVHSDTVYSDMGDDNYTLKNIDEDTIAALSDQKALTFSRLIADDVSTVDFDTSSTDDSDTTSGESSPEKEETKLKE